MILLVDRETSLRATLIATLAGMGYTALAASTCYLAIQWLEDGLTPELVFADTHVADMLDGLNLAYWLQHNRPNTPLLLQSSMAIQVPRDLIILRKPYSREELSESLRCALARKAPEALSAKTHGNAHE